MADEAAQIWAQDEFHFHGQRPDEHVMIIKNKHPIVLLGVGAIAIVSLIIPFGLSRLTGGKYELAGLIIYAIILAIYLGYHLYGYRLSICVLTNQRIVNVAQKGFFNCSISEAELTRIQDVSSEIKGVAATMFGVGNVTIRTASETLLILKQIGDPYEMQQAIVRALKESKS